MGIEIRSLLVKPDSKLESQSAPGIELYSRVIPS